MEEPVLSPLQLSEREIMFRIDYLFHGIQWDSVERFVEALREMHKNNPEHFENYTKMIESRAETCRSVINDSLNSIT